jgi:hypothetical protein
MSIIGDVFKELFKMFVADMRLTLTILIGVALVALLLDTGLVGATLAGLILTVLCLGVLIEAVMRETRKRRAKG